MSTQQSNGAAMEGAKPKAIARPKVDWDKPTDKAGLEQCGGMIVAQMQKVLPTALRGQADRMIRALIMTCQSQQKLMNCTPVSLFGSAMVAARLGLEIGGPLGHAFLIPFKDSATLIIGYKGLADLAWRSGNIVGISPQTVCQKDQFSFQLGTSARLDHIPAEGFRGPVKRYYVCVRTKFSDISTFDTMTLQDAIEFRDRYATVKGAPDFVKKNSPWYDIDERDPANPQPFNGFHAMAQKTIFRRMSKTLPLSTEFALAAGIDEAAERPALQPYQEDVGLLLGTSDRPPLHEGPEGDAGQQSGGDEQPQGEGEKSSSQKLKDRMDKAKSGGQ